MRLPWTKQWRTLSPPPPPITDEEMAERRAKFEAYRQELAERTARIPRNLEGYRLIDGCTCGAQARAEATWGKDMRLWSSMGIAHEDDCEELRGLFIRIIEDDGSLVLASPRTTSMRDIWTKSQ